MLEIARRFEEFLNPGVFTRSKAGGSRSGPHTLCDSPGVINHHTFRHLVNPKWFDFSGETQEPRETRSRIAKNP